MSLSKARSLKNLSGSKVLKPTVWVPALVAGAVLMVSSMAMTNSALAKEEKELSPAAEELKKAIKASTKYGRSKLARKINAAISRFYKERDYKYFWYDGGSPNKRATKLLTALDQVDAHGLDASHYGLPGLAKQVSSAGAALRPAMEAKLTKILISYAGDLKAGSIAPHRTAPGVYMRPKQPDTAELLTEAEGSSDFNKFLSGLQPQTKRYRSLKLALRKYRALAAAGGWPKIPRGRVLRKDMKDPRIAVVKRRLLVTRDLKAIGPTPNLYDDALLAAVKRFQVRQGIRSNGLIGKDTQAAMNITAKQRVQQIAINMERRRWMPKNLGKLYVWVNIADFFVKIVKNDKTFHTAKIVVGKTYHKTPIFSHKITYVEFNPHWNVPRSIATKEMLPIIKRNPGYLRAGNYMLLRRALDNSSEVDPYSVDWSAISRSNFPYYIRQKPGPWNALGTMIFMFPNRFNVFLHDTAARHLFDRYRVRSFSHGCMRVQYPHIMAKILLAANPGWDVARIRRTVQRKKPQTVRLKTAVPVHITYMTAFATRNGTVHFRRDFYRRDRTLSRLLNRRIRTASR